MIDQWTRNLVPPRERKVEIGDGSFVVLVAAASACLIGCAVILALTLTGVAT